MAWRLRRSKKTDEQLIIDRVTGTFNRRQLDLDLAAGVDVSGLSTASLMLHVDNFEQFGKRGPASANQILERVAWVVMATVRTSDIVYRHSRSSFCVLLPATTDEQAIVAAERIRSNIESTPLLTNSNATVSVGAAIGDSDQVSKTARRADAALATAGQNSVVHS
jgi:diguanylate cyclase (GGDEF)-like protein